MNKEVTQNRPPIDAARLLKLADDTLQTEAIALETLRKRFLQEDAERFGSRGKTVGNANAGFGELAQKFAKRCILTANAVHIGHAKLTKGKIVTTLYHLCPLCPHHSADGNTGVD